jgi:hypothetical protein
MMRTAIRIGFAVSVLGLAFASTATVRADDYNKKTRLTFSQPVEIPGKVLPAGTYIFRLADSLTDRHIVQIFNADESTLLATVMAIPDYRLTATEATVIKFDEVPSGSPEAIRAWFYPGSTIGQEFVYAKPRAMQLAKAAKAVVPAIADNTSTDINALRTAPIVAVTPDERELPVMSVIQMTPPSGVLTVADTKPAADVAASEQRTPPHARNGRHLPQTASSLPLIALVGLGSIALALGLMVFGRYAAPSGVV